MMMRANHRRLPFSSAVDKNAAPPEAALNRKRFVNARPGQSVLQISRRLIRDCGIFPLPAGVKFLRER